LGDYFPFGFQPIFTGELAVTRVLKTKTAEKGAKTNPPKNQRLRFLGVYPFFQTMIPVHCYTKHIQTPFINEEKAFGSSPGNAHCENSAKVLMWWPP